MLTSIKQAGVQTVPRARSTDAIGNVLRSAFGCAAVPDDMQTLLRRLDWGGRNT